MPDNAFEVFVGRHNAKLVQLLERNHSVSMVIQGILEASVEFCNAKGCDYEELELIDSFVLPTDDGDARIEARFRVRPRV